MRPVPQAAPLALPSDAGTHGGSLWSPAWEASRGGCAPSGRAGSGTALAGTIVSTAGLQDAVPSSRISFSNQLPECLRDLAPWQNLCPLKT